MIPRESFLFIFFKLLHNEGYLLIRPWCLRRSRCRCGRNVSVVKVIPPLCDFIGHSWFIRNSKIPRTRTRIRRSSSSSSSSSPWIFCRWILPISSTTTHNGRVLILNNLIIHKAPGGSGWFSSVFKSTLELSFTFRPSSRTSCTGFVPWGVCHN